MDHLLLFFVRPLTYEFTFQNVLLQLFYRFLVLAVECYFKAFPSSMQTTFLKHFPNLWLTLYDGKLLCV